MKPILLILALSLSSHALAGLQSLSNHELQQVEGQAGADIALKVTLNQNATGQFDSNLCSDLRYCRVALNFNNRGSEATGDRQWLVFKGVQGMINIQRLGLDGADLQYTSANQNVLKPAIQLSSAYGTPILFRDFGFDTLSIEKDSGTGSSNAGYLANTSGGTANVNSYANGKYTVAGYDNGREVGFTGLKLNGNLGVNGKLMIFSCGSTHPRC